MKNFRYQDLVIMKKPYLEDQILDKQLEEFINQRKNNLLTQVKEFEALHEEFNQVYQKQEEIKCFKEELQETKNQKQQGKDEIQQNCQLELDRFASERKEREENEEFQQKQKEQKIQENLAIYQKEYENEYQKLLEIEDQINQFKKKISSGNDNNQIYDYLNFINLRESQGDLSETAKALEVKINSEKNKISKLQEQLKNQGLNEQKIKAGKTQEAQLIQPKKNDINDLAEIENELYFLQAEINLKVQKIMSFEQMLSYLAKQEQLLKDQMQTIFSKNKLLLTELNDSEQIQDKSITWVYMINFLCKYLYKSVQECDKYQIQQVNNNK